MHETDYRFATYVELCIQILNKVLENQRNAILHYTIT